MPKEISDVQPETEKFHTLPNNSKEDLVDNVKSSSEEKISEISVKNNATQAPNDLKIDEKLLKSLAQEVAVADMYNRLYQEYENMVNLRERFHEPGSIDTYGEQLKEIGYRCKVYANLIIKAKSVSEKNKSEMQEVLNSIQQDVSDLKMEESINSAINSAINSGTDKKLSLEKIDFKLKASELIQTKKAEHENRLNTAVTFFHGVGIKKNDSLDQMKEFIKGQEDKTKDTEKFYKIFNIDIKKYKKESIRNFKSKLDSLGDERKLIDKALVFSDYSNNIGGVQGLNEQRDKNIERICQLGIDICESDVLSYDDKDRLLHYQAFRALGINELGSLLGENLKDELSIAKIQSLFEERKTKVARDPRSQELDTEQDQKKDQGKELDNEQGQKKDQGKKPNLGARIIRGLKDLGRKIGALFTFFSPKDERDKQDESYQKTPSESQSFTKDEQDKQDESIKNEIQAKGQETPSGSQSFTKEDLYAPLEYKTPPRSKSLTEKIGKEDLLEVLNSGKAIHSHQSDKQVIKSSKGYITAKYPKQRANSVQK